jgi:hypothetical protein
MPPALKLDEKIPEWIRDRDDSIPIRPTALLEEPDRLDDQAIELARKQIEKQERDEYEALQAAVQDLIRLERYERRAWSPQKRAIREFIAVRVYSISQIPPTTSGF